MEFKVKEILKEEKSRVEVENELLKKHEEKFEDSDVKEETQAEKINLNKSENSPSEEISVDETKTPSSELNDEDVLSYIKNRYDKDINSVDDLFAEKEANPDLPEDVSAYFKYKQETGRGIEDFYKLQKDLDSMDDNAILSDYYGMTEDGLDAIDIQDIIEDKFSFDEDLDDPKDIKKIKLDKKRELAKAKKFLNEYKDKYKAPLESSGGGLSEDQEKNLNAYKSYIEESKTAEERQKKTYNYFLDKTNKLFNSEFKGFEFDVSESKMVFKPGANEELKNIQSNINNFVNKFLDKDGLMADAEGYHRALSVAMNPDKFAQHFYDQGVASAVDNVSRKSKNINMDVRQSSQAVTKDGMKIRPMSNNSRNDGRGLKIRSIKKS